MKKRWLAALLALLMVIGTVGMVAAEEADEVDAKSDEELMEEKEGQGPPAHIQKMLEMKAALGEEDDEDDEDEDDEDGPPDFVLAMKALKIDIMSKSKLKINGNSFKSDLPPVIKYGRTLIPVGAVVRGLGADDVIWDGEGENQTVTIIKYDENGKIDIEIVLEIGKKVYTVSKDGSMEVFEMDSAAEILGNRTYVPLKYIALAMGVPVEYDEETKVINVGKKLGHEKAAEAKMNKDKDSDEEEVKVVVEEEEEEE